MAVTSEGLKRIGSSAVAAGGDEVSALLVGDFSPLYSSTQQ